MYIFVYECKHCIYLDHLDHLNKNSNKYIINKKIFLIQMNFLFRSHLDQNVGI